MALTTMRRGASLLGFQRWRQAVWMVLALTLTTGVAGHEAHAADCPLPAPRFSSAQGAFGLSDACELRADSEEPQAVFQFFHRGKKGDTLGTYWGSQDTLAAVISDELQDGLKFWDGHILTLDLPEERGGVLVIANWTGKQFVISEYAYQTGDEDSMELSWLDGAFIVKTEADGKRRLLAGHDANAGAFAQEALACSWGKGQSTQSLSLPIDMRGEVTGVSYAGTTPAPDGTAYVCLVDVKRDDGRAEWVQEKDGVLIVFNADDTAVQDGPSDPDRLRVTHKADVFTLDLDVFAPRYCGQSARMARQISMKKGDPTCTSVELDGL
ncbi:MAG: hypothetical protein WBA83_02760 [Burkholderiaceae bacterium]